MFRKFFKTVVVKIKAYFRILLLAVLSMGVPLTTVSAGALEVDAAHSKVEFTVPHMVIASVTGRFDKFEGTSKFDEKTGRLTDLVVKIKTDSINTNDEKRNGHLKSPDFFDAEKNPAITFAGSGSVVLRPGVPTKLSGTLTLRGISKQIGLTVTYKGSVKDPSGAIKYVFEANTKINRKDFGIIWNKPLDNGGVLIGEDVKIQIAVEANPTS
ncbi:YceI family protein [Leptospira adleri]|uniref:YceI family protein n=1 Tax=Leptospira adleri TaxID=2023186 RepID=UPI001FD0ABE8|nr:YceI family protein [Leptospira adleri]